jgi:hypothetical protein
LKVLEKQGFQKIEQEAKQHEQEEKLRIHDKRRHYRRQLDQ